MGPQGDGPAAASARELLSAARARGGDRPYLTYRDVGSGERTELGYATFENWASKAADALAEEGVEPGDVVAVTTAGHWSGLVAVWACGLLGAAARLVEGAGLPPRPRAARLAVTHEDAAAGTGQAGTELLVGDGLGGRPATDGEAFVDVALSGSDVYDDPEVGLDHDWLLVGDRSCWQRLSAGNLAAAAQALAGWGLAGGERVLVTTPLEQPSTMVLAVAVAAVGGQVVAVRGGGTAQWLAAAEEERVDWLATDAAGVDALGSAEPGGHGLSGVLCLDGVAAPRAALASTRLGVGVATGSGLATAAYLASLTPRDLDAATAAWLATEPGQPGGALLGPVCLEEQDGELCVGGPLASPGVEGAEEGADTALGATRHTGVLGALRHGPDGRTHVLLR